MMEFVLVASAEGQADAAAYRLKLYVRMLVTGNFIGGSGQTLLL
jgi:hypothetical protein